MLINGANCDAYSPPDLDAIRIPAYTRFSFLQNTRWISSIPLCLVFCAGRMGTWGLVSSDGMNVWDTLMVLRLEIFGPPRCTYDPTFFDSYMGAFSSRSHAHSPVGISNLSLALGERRCFSNNNILHSSEEDLVVFIDPVPEMRAGFASLIRLLTVSPTGSEMDKSYRDFALAM